MQCTHIYTYHIDTYTQYKERKINFVFPSPEDRGGTYSFLCPRAWDRHREGTRVTVQSLFYYPTYPSIFS